MSVTVKLHILDTSITSEEEVAVFGKSLNMGNTSKWDLAYDHIATTPSLIIGDDDGNPSQVIENLQELLWYDTPMELTEEFLQQILDAYPEEGAKYYIHPNRVRQEAEEFLRQYMGQKVFLVAW